MAIEDGGRVEQSSSSYGSSGQEIFSSQVIFDITAKKPKSVEASSNVSKSDSSDGFPIRGHHLDSFEEVHAGWASAWSLRRGAELSRNRLDYMGPTHRDADKHEQDLAKVFDEFENLSDDAKVKLVTDQKDKICDTCVIGKHCSQYGGQYNQDEAYLESFRRAAQERGVAGDITEVVEEATYSDAPSRNVVSYLTTAGTVKRMFTTDFTKSEKSLFQWYQQVALEFIKKQNNLKS